MTQVYFSLNKEPHWKYCHYVGLPRWQSLLGGGGGLKALEQPTFFQVLISGKFSVIANISWSNTESISEGKMSGAAVTAGVVKTCLFLCQETPGAVSVLACSVLLEWTSRSGKVSRQKASVDIVVVSPGHGWDISLGWYEGKFPLTIVPSLHPPPPRSSAAGFPKELSAQELSFQQLAQRG